MKVLNTEYDFVAIIDCLSDKERRDSNDSGKLAQFLAKEGINNRYYYCGNKVSVLHLLTELASESWNGMKFPIVFISHGTNLSLLMKHRMEDIEWNELRDPLGDLNKNMAGDLFVLMACCYGFQGYKIDKRDAREETFFGIVGPLRKISPEESIRANEIFFGGLLSGRPIPQCVMDINATLGEDTYRALATQDNKLN